MDNSSDILGDWGPIDDVGNATSWNRSSQASEAANTSIGVGCAQPPEMYDNYDDGYFYRHSTAITIVYCLGYSVVFVLGLIGNCLVVGVVFRTPRMRT